MTGTVSVILGVSFILPFVAMVGVFIYHRINLNKKKAENAAKLSTFEEEAKKVVLSKAEFEEYPDAKAILRNMDMDSIMQSYQPMPRVHKEKSVVR